VQAKRNMQAQNNAKQSNMQVYNVYGLGFGDDESQWELCSTHATREGADAARAVILAEDPELEVCVQAQQVQQ